MERAEAGTSAGNMPRFLLALQSQSRTEAERARVQEQDLRRWGLTGQWPWASFHPGRPTHLSRAGEPASGTIRRCPG